MVEEGGKRHNPSSSPLVFGINHTKVDWPDADPKDVAEDGLGTADEFLALLNWGNVNNNGITDDMAWNTMVQEEI